MEQYSRHKLGTADELQQPQSPDVRYNDDGTIVELDPAGKSAVEVARWIETQIRRVDPEGDRYATDYCSGNRYTPDARPADPIRDGYRWISVYAVTGGSEGHYIHVDLIYQRDEQGTPLERNQHEAIVLVKVFGGWEAAAELAGRIGRWLGA